MFYLEVPGKCHSQTVRTILSFLNVVCVLSPSVLKGGEKPSGDKSGTEGAVTAASHHQTDHKLPSSPYTVTRWSKGEGAERGLLFATTTVDRGARTQVKC